MSVKRSQVKSKSYQDLIDTHDWQGLFEKGYVSLEVNLMSEGIEIVDMKSDQVTFFPRFSATLTNNVTSEIYLDQSSGCRVKFEDSYKFTGGGFMETCGIVAHKDGYEIRDPDRFIDLITQPAVCQVLSLSDICICFGFLIVMCYFVWGLKQLSVN